MLFKVYTDFVLKKPKTCLAMVVIITLVMGWFAQYFRLDASADSLVIEGDADLEFSRAMSERYGTSDFVFITYTPHGELFTEVYLQRFRALKNELAGIEVVSSIDSIFDMPLFKVAGVSLSEVADNLITLDTPGVDLEAAKADLRTTEAYQDLLISRDGNTVSLVVNLENNQELERLLARRTELRNLRDGPETLSREQVEELQKVSEDYENLKIQQAEELHLTITTIREILDRYRSDADIAMGGVPMIADDLITFVKKDLQSFGIAIIAFIILSLGYLFGRVRFVVIPMLCCLITAIIVVGLLGMFDWPVTVISSNFISLLLIITVSLTVHLMVRYREFAASDPDQPYLERIRLTLEKMFRPCIYNSMTTMTAFGFLVMSQIPPIINFGWMMLIGVAFTFVVTFLVFPAVMALLPPTGKAPKHRAFDITGLAAKLTEAAGNTVVIVCVILMLFGGLGISQLEVENSFIDYFDDSTEIYQGMVTIDQKMGGTTPLEVIVDLYPPGMETEFENSTAELDEWEEDEFFFEDEFFDEESSSNDEAYWFTSDKMAEIIAIHEFLESLPETGKVLSLATVLGIAYELNDDKPLDSIELAVLYNRIPDNYKQSLIQPYVSIEHDQVRFSVRIMETDPSLQRESLLARIRSGLQSNFELEPEQVKLTGMLVLYNNMLQSLFDSQIKTLSLVLLVIFVMFLFLFRSLRLALIAIMPNILAVCTVLGLMGWLGIPLDMMTITIASITVGIGVDDTIHYVHRFKTQFPLQNRNYLSTMHACHGSIGKAMYYTSFTIVAGFSILVLSNFIPTIYFGLLTSLAMIIALAGALTLLPQLLIMIKPFGKEGSAEA